MKNSYQQAFTRAAFAGLLLSAGATAATAQTSGTLTAQQPLAAGINYSQAPWLITAGTGTYPDGGGAATFNPIINTIVGVPAGSLAGATTVTVDVSPTLSGITVNTPFFGFLAAGTGTSIIAANTGLTINTALTQVTPTAFGFGIGSPISGGGTAGLTKTGSGNLNIATVTNTYTGGTHFNGGTTFLTAATTAAGDALLGATGVGNGLSFNGGSVFSNVTGGFTTARDITLDAGGGTFITATAITLNGVISGAGSLTNTAFTAGTGTTLTAANTYTGATISTTTPLSTGLITSPTLTLSGNGSTTASSRYDLFGTLNLDNTGTNVTNRLNDAAPVTLRGVNFVSTGNATATSSETIGAVTGASSLNTILVTPGGGTTTPQANSLTMASLARQNNAIFAFRGTGLGGTPGVGVANIYSTAAPTLAGGGGGAGSTTISVLPYAFGNSTNSVLFTAAGLVNSSLVTYDAGGFRPLAATEYAPAFGVSNLDNVRLTAATVAGAGVTANAVVFAPTAAAALSGGTINLTSGAFLYSPTANVTGTVSAALNFGAAEGVIMNTSLLNVSGVLSGSNGLTLGQGYTPTSQFTPNTTLTGANTYTGNTTINSGLVGFSGTVAEGTAGAFGTSGTIVLNAGNNLAGLAPTAATTFNRDISVIGSGLNFISSVNSGYAPTFNGNISLAGNLTLYGYTNVVGNALNFNGVISGTGAILDNGLTYGVFTGNNTFTGGLSVNTSSFYAGSDTAFGTGAITFYGAGTVAGVGVAARSLANNVVLNASATFGGTAPLTLTGGVNLNGARTITTSNTALTAFNGVVSNGALTKTGTGAMALNSPTGNTYTGGTVLGANVGTLYVNNTSGSGTGAGTVSIGGTSQTVYSTLAGNFIIAGNTAIAGRLSPGNGAGLTAATAGQGSVGIATFGGNLSLSSAATPTTSSLFVDIASAVSFDKLNVAGQLTLNGTVFLAVPANAAVQVGNVLDIADWTSLALNPTVTFDVSNVAAGFTFDTSRFTVDGSITVTAVPEPGTYAMLGFGGLLAAVVSFMRRRVRGQAC